MVKTPKKKIKKMLSINPREPVIIPVDMRKLLGVSFNALTTSEIVYFKLKRGPYVTTAIVKQDALPRVIPKGAICVDAYPLVRRPMQEDHAETETHIFDEAANPPVAQTMTLLPIIPPPHFEPSFSRNDYIRASHQFQFTAGTMPARISVYNLNNDDMTSIQDRFVLLPPAHTDDIVQQLDVIADAVEEPAEAAMELVVILEEPEEWLCAACNLVITGNDIAEMWACTQLCGEYWICSKKSKACLEKQKDHEKTVCPCCPRKKKK